MLGWIVKYQKFQKSPCGNQMFGKMGSVEAVRFNPDGTFKIYVEFPGLNGTWVFGSQFFKKHKLVFSMSAPI